MSETKKILDMISSGAISPEEGEKLLDALKPKGESRKCPFCAELISAQAVICPECNSELRRTGGGSGTGRSFKSLGSMSKFLIFYMLFVTIVILISNGSALVQGHIDFFQSALAAFGLTAAILMCKGNKTGWIMGIIWSVAQIVTIIVGNMALNRQFFFLGVNTTTNGTGIGLNLTGIILVVLFSLSREDWKS